MLESCLFQASWSKTSHIGLVFGMSGFVVHRRKMKHGFRTIAAGIP